MIVTRYFPLSAGVCVGAGGSCFWQPAERRRMATAKIIRRNVDADTRKADGIGALLIEIDGEGNTNQTNLVLKVGKRKFQEGIG